MEPPANLSSQHAVSKLAAEYYCQVFCESYGLNTLCIRYFNAYGPRQVGGSYGGVTMRFINRLKRRKYPIVYGDRKKTSGFMHVADIVRANVLALDGPRGIGGIIDVGSGRSTTINTLADFLIALSGKSNLRPIYAALKREISKIAVLTQLKLREY